MAFQHEVQPQEDNSRPPTHVRMSQTHLKAAVTYLRYSLLADCLSALGGSGPVQCSCWFWGVDLRSGNVHQSGAASGQPIRGASACQANTNTHTHTHTHTHTNMLVGL
uniref:Uncharacterized protein n=1 Tax=Eutreptiella gymnastica TaxID=73025 RepID=A0A7S4CZH6_9EUGL